MSLGTALAGDIGTRAIVAYLHYLSFMLCFAALALERIFLKQSPSRSDLISLAIADIVYGLAALVLLITGILRVLYFGQGADFYTHNPLFWIKVGVFLGVGALSLYPTFTYIIWAITLRKGETPDIKNGIIPRLKSIVNIELLGFTLIPLLAVLMARGVTISL